MVDYSRKIVIAFSPSFLKLHAAVRNRIRYSGGIAPSRMGREVDDLLHTYTHTYIYILYIYVAGGITNEKKSRVIGNDLLLHILTPYLTYPVSRVEETRKTDGTALSVSFSRVFLKR